MVRRLRIRDGLVLVVFTLLTTYAHSLEYEPIKDPFRDRFILHGNGFTYHRGSSDKDLNGQNWGVGFGYELGRLSSESVILNHAVLSFNTDFYRDSFNEFGYLVGVALQNRLAGPINLGVQVGFVHEDNIVDKGGWYLFPYLVPFVETTFDFPVNCRVTVVPPLKGYTDGLVTFQFLMRF